MAERGTAAERHRPVLRARVVELLAPALQRPGAVYVDGTLGMGGHAEAMAAAAPEALIVGVDRDAEALALAGERLAPLRDRLVLVHTAYDDVQVILDAIETRAGRRTVDAALFDLGVSSLQLDAADRGFAYAQDAPLDMRMDPSSGITAAEVLATYPVGALSRVLSEYGEERFARRIAQAIVARRDRHPLTTSAELVELLRQSVPAASQRTGGHPAKRTFQALRIEVNDELGCWQRALPRMLDATAVGGRIAVLSYHSLEDRITKTELVSRTTTSAPHGLPVIPTELAPTFELLTRGSEQASERERLDNPRSSSVRLRAAVRVRPSKGASR
ncbi:MAG: 16S rRNA (cytosine(1402)-N(4))-methyltransferase RsmH [Tetrasphaera sp.]|nr:16S rRNA (cytosine(1402)-N(4))-methyltransferase RsmH [Tetrasphaera sp.]